jgi:hypothetical protein
MTIQKTIDYDKFHCISGNRDIHPGNLKKITASIKYKNMLDINPIIVDKNGGIIDGQHRWEACKALGAVLHYIEKESFDPVDIITLNTNKKCWSIDDYVKHYATYGEPIFKKVVELMNKYSYTMTEILSFMGKDAGGVKSGIKMGLFKGDIDSLTLVIGEKKEQLDEITEYIRKRSLEETFFVRASAFRSALVNIMTCHGYSHMLFMSKLSQMIHKVTRRAGRKEYFKMLCDIYNHRNSNPIIIEDE